MYNLILLLLQGGTKIGGLVRYPLILSKASCCSGPHSNTSLFNRSKGEKACAFPLRLDINHLKKFILPSRDCSSFLFVGAFASTIAFVLFWLILIPFLWTTKPKKSPAFTQNSHFKGFIFRPCFLILLNDCRRWSIWFFLETDFTIISSIYTCMKVLIKSWKIEFIAR